MDNFIHSWKIVILVLSVFSLIVNISASTLCPSMCTCGKYGPMPYLNCEGKRLREFPGNISQNTEILRFRGNEITRLPKDLPTLLPNAITLSFENNKVTMLSDGLFSNLPKLQEVFVSYNKIQSIGKRLFANSAPGQSINFLVEGNLIENIADEVFQNCSATFIVNWKSNRIKILTPGVFVGAEGIHNLNLEGNLIEKLQSGTFKDLNKMYFLGLGDNSLSEINQAAFQGLHRLETLTMQKNRLSSLPVNTFKDLSVMKEINLESNLFTELPIDAIRMLPSFSKVKLKNNPIKCTCKLKSDLSDESIKNKIADLNDIQCVNINKSVLAAITDVNCVTEAPTTSPTQPTMNTRNKFQSTTKKTANEIVETTTISKFTPFDKDVMTNANPEKNGYESQTSQPLIIGVAIGSAIIVVVIILFVYLYRRPIARRAASTMSLPRKKNRSEPKKEIFYQRSPFNDYSTDYNI